MLSIRRTYFWIFLYMLIIQPIAPYLLKFTDELGVLFMLILVLLDIAVNKNYGRYKGLYLVIGIMAFYAIYSMTMLDFSIPKAIVMDFVIQLKPYVVFFFTLAIAPTFTNSEKQILKGTAIGLSAFVIILGVISFVNMRFSESILGHIAMVGTVSLCCVCTYIYCSVDENGNISRKNILLASMMLLGGLLCTRSKYYGECIFALYLLFIYRPGVLRQIKVKQIILFVAVFIGIIAAAWSKIEFYFITGTGDTFDLDELESIARPALYGGAFLILLDFPLLGSGLASYATYASMPQIFYSNAYHAYDIDKVWGLSPDTAWFICDAFFPEMAQFGLIGVGLFIYFFRYIYNNARLALHTDSKFYYIITLIVIANIFIENTSACTFVQSQGAFQMMVVGMIVSRYMKFDKTQYKEILSKPFVNNNRK